MKLVEDEYELRADETAQQVAHASIAQCLATTPIAPLKDRQGSESTILYTFDRAEILALLEITSPGDSSERREITSLFDLYRDVSQAQDSLRRALAGETLETVKNVAGRVYETHLVPLRNRRNEVNGILCIALDRTHTDSQRAAQVLEERLLTEENLRKSESQMQTLLDAIPDRMFQINREGVILHYKAVPGDAPELMIGTSITRLLTPLVVQQVFNAMKQAQETRAIQVFECHQLFGETMRFNEVRVAVTGNGEFVCIVRSITEYKRVVEALRTSEQLYHSVVSNAPIVLFALDAAGIYTLHEGKALHTMGIKSGQRIGLSALEFNRGSPLVLAALRRALAGETLTIIVQARGKVLELQLTPMRDAGKKLSGVIGVGTDITERVHAEEALRHQSLHDPLTDLANRTLLLARMAEALAVAEPVGGDMALIMLDLKRFKEVNDTFGHQRGDLLLQQVGLRLSQAISAEATLARLGGDEFAVFLPTADEACAQQVASTLCTALEEPFLVEDYPLQVESSMGIALYPGHGTTSLTLFRHADVAMYAAKQEHQVYAFYDTRRDPYSLHRLNLLGDLRKAIATNELRLYYQPKADLHTGLVTSVEALVRWQHPTRGLIPPDQFIPLAEQTGLIEPLTHWMVETAVAQCRRWLESGITLNVAVNLSMWNLRDASLPDAIARLLARYTLPARFLTVEITESAAMADTAYTLRALKRLFALGVRIAIDDYGTGYASLSYLKHLPADELKIDRAFVQHMAEDQVDQAIVRSTVNLAHSMGMRVVAEGVEDQATWNLLVALGCDIVQGYYLSRPICAQDLEHWLDERKAAAVRSLNEGKEAVAL